MFEVTTGRADAWILRVRSVAEAELAGLLSPGEIEKGRRFRFQKDRDLSWNARAALRMLLGKYLGIAGADVRFAYEASGRPVLAPDLAAGGLHFSVSHSGGRVAIAIARAEVGVDIEHRGGAARILDRPAESLREWTRTEAYLKAIGTGLTGSRQCPDSSWVFFDLSDEEYAGAVAVRGPCAECRRFVG